jgi:hypothetical protein
LWNQFACHGAGTAACPTGTPSDPAPIWLLCTSSKSKICFENGVRAGKPIKNATDRTMSVHIFCHLA